MSGAEQTRESWRYPGDKLNRNLLGRVEGLTPPTAYRPVRTVAPMPRHRRRHLRLQLILYADAISFQHRQETTSTRV